MMFEVLNAHGADALRWQSLWDRLPHDLRDVHYTPAYGRVQEVLGGSARCMVYEWDGWFVMQPFMLRDINLIGSPTIYRDIASMYGHGGPLCTMRSTSSNALMEWCEIEFARWRADHKVVSEFCALHPMMVKDQDRLIHADAQVREVRQTVVMRVDWADSEIIAGMRSDRRQNLEKADVDVGPSRSGLFSFAQLYYQTVERHKARDKWWFRVEYFQAHESELRDRMLAVDATTRGLARNAVSASLLLFGHHHAHYQFTGNADDVPRGANDKLIMEAARLARRAGCTWLLLGGGTTSAPDDSLLQFKAGFSKHRAPARVYTRVFDADAYARLCREAGRDPLDRSGFFPAYRAEAV